MISVLMPVYNETENELRLSIESILNQTYRDFELIIVLDNPSNEGLRGVIKNYAEKHRNIVFLENEENLGASKSLNRALGVAKGEFIARLDADDVSLNFRLEEQLKYLNENRLDLVGSYYQEINEEGSIILGRVIKAPHNPLIIHRLIPIQDCIGHSTWLAKIDVYKKLGGYRNFKAALDYDFLLRAAKHGFTLGILPKICVLYRVRSNSITNRHKERQGVTAQFLSDRYEYIETVNEFDLEIFLSTVEGKKAIDRKKVHDNMCEKLLVYKQNNNVIRYYLQAIKIIFYSEFGRTMLKYKILLVKNMLN